MVVSWYNILSCIVKYFAQNAPLSILGFYFISSVLLKAFTPLDITIPCLYFTFFGTKCMGCGMTTAFTHLANFNFEQAYYSNKLIFLVIPIASVWITYDFTSFLKKNTCSDKKLGN